jgi:hypothetical protein
MYYVCYTWCYLVVLCILERIVFFSCFLLFIPRSTAHAWNRWICGVPTGVALVFFLAGCFSALYFARGPLTL